MESEKTQTEQEGFKDSENKKDFIFLRKPLNFETEIIIFKEDDLNYKIKIQKWRY